MASSNGQYGRAVACYKRAAALGEPRAMWRLGEMYEHGLGMDADAAAAAQLYLTAAGAGNIDGMFHAGRVLEQGLGIAADPAEAARWFFMASKAGSVAAECELARCYLDGVGVDQDLDKARRWAKRARAGGAADADALLERVQERVDRAAAILEKAGQDAGDAADADVFYRAGMAACREGLYPEGRMLLKRAVKLGCPAAMHQMGILYWSGEGVQKNENRAVKFFRHAADGDYAPAKCSLGAAYELGRGGLEVSVKTAGEYYRQAARQGCPEAMCRLAALLHEGNGVPHDPEAAVLLYRQAADQGCVDAQYRLGCLYARGEGVERDDAMAVQLFYQAAKQGHEKARLELEQCYKWVTDVISRYEAALERAKSGGEADGGAECKPLDEMLRESDQAAWPDPSDDAGDGQREDRADLDALIRAIRAAGGE